MKARRDKQNEKADVCTETVEVLADDAEIAGIFADEKLLKRLKKGSAAARDDSLSEYCIFGTAHHIAAY